MFLSQILKGQGAVDGTEGGIRRHLSRQVARGGSSSGTASPDLAGLEQRLDAIERALEIKNGTSSAGAGVDGGPGTVTSYPIHYGREKAFELHVNPQLMCFC